MKEVLEMIKFYMDGEINNFIKVWLSVFISLTYCYYAVRLVPNGTTSRLTRLLLFLPVISLFLYLPLTLHTMHLGGMTAFFLAWLANFKILLFAFNKGPLSDPSISLPQFIALACLPIRIRKPNSGRHEKSIKHNDKSFRFLDYLLKGALVASFLKFYDHSEHVHPQVIWLVFFLHIYFMLDIMLGIVAALARAVLGVELEPQFNNPYLATSLQDFWGRRWNLMVTSILRPTVYEPVRGLATGHVGSKTAPLMAVVATFVVSSVMHELIFYYLGRVKPTWEITLFFMIHGASMVAEVLIKRWWFSSGRQPLPRVVSGMLTVGFVLATANWLFLPPLLRCKGDVRAFEEYKLMGRFVKDVHGALRLKRSKIN